MTEVSATSAGQIVNVDRETVRRWSNQELIPARRMGLKGVFRIDVEELRKFAEKYRYDFNEELAKRLAQN